MYNCTRLYILVLTSTNPSSYYSISCNYSLGYYSRIRKNYIFIGANKACNNAFFINKSEVDKLNIDLPDPNNLEKYTQSNILESRSNSGNLTFLSDTQKLKEISDCEVINLTDGLEKRSLIRDLFKV